MPKPYRQGQLDGLCGVYALINAVNVLCGPLTMRQSQALFRDILLFLESRGPLADRCVDGLYIQQIASVLKHVVCQQYPIIRFKPFHRCPRVGIHRYLQTLEDFLSVPNRVVFTAIEGHYSHWTLISRITEHTLQVYDSDAMHCLLKSSCSMIHQQDAKRHWLLPAHTYLLQRKG